MSELKTNSISTHDGNNVAMDNSFKLKSYSTSARNSLTSVAGDMIYNSDDNKVQYYNGSSWVDTGSAFFNIEYLSVAGGGSGGGAQTYRIYSGGGGAGGFLTNKSGATAGGGGALNPGLAIAKDGSTTFKVTVGAGGAGVTGNGQGNSGSNSEFAGYTAIGGGKGGGYNSAGLVGGSGGGGFNGGGGNGTANQGYAGANG